MQPRFFRGHISQWSRKAGCGVVVKFFICLFSPLCFFYVFLSSSIIFPTSSSGVISDKMYVQFSWVPFYMWIAVPETSCHHLGTSSKFSHAPDSSTKNAETQIKRKNLTANRCVQSTHFDCPIESCYFKIAQTVVHCFLSEFWSLGACGYSTECVRVGTTVTYLMQQFKVWSLAVLFARLFF